MTLEDQPVQKHEPGSAAAAWSHRPFRIVYIGSLLSNIGRWMQFVGLTAFMAALTGDASIVGAIVFAQLGPLLFLSTTGGVLADTWNRKRLLMVTQSFQMVLAFALAAAVVPDDPNTVLIFFIVFAGGCFQAIFAPTWQAVIPTLVGQRDLGGAVALNSIQLNVSRVVGPAIGGALFPVIQAEGVFFVNGVTYLFVLGALMMVDIPQPEPDTSGPRGWRKLLNGARIARATPLYLRILVVMTSFSFLSLPFVGQLPIVAQRNLGIDPESGAYGLLYSGGLGLGALVGALAIGTVFARTPRPVVVRWSLISFGILLAVFAALRSAPLAYPVLFVLGASYFALITALSTLLQEHLAPNERGQIMALWIMSFGGTVPLANLWAGPAIEFTSVTPVLLVGAVWALWLAYRNDVLAGLAQAHPRPTEV